MPKEDTENVKPKKWWQWVFLYPTVAVTLISAIPTIIKAFDSFKMDVPFSQVEEAKLQQKMWTENFDCLRTAVFYRVVNKVGSAIESAVCESGDVLIRGKRPEWSGFQYRWVSWADVAPVIQNQNSGALANKVEQANAVFNAVYRPGNDNGLTVLKIQYGPQLICQAFVGPNLLRQRFMTPSGCFDQIINTYSGWVVGTSPAPCSC